MLLAASSDLDAPVVQPDCWAAWRSGNPTIVAPQPITAINTVFYATGSPSEIDITTRPARDQPFSPGTPVGALDDPAVGDSGVAFTADGSVGVLSSNGSGAFSTLDLSQFTRTAGQFSALDAMPYAAVNTANNEQDPELSPDGLTVYYASEVGTTTEVIMVATRASTTGPFDPPTSLAISGAMPLVNNPRVSPDGLVLLYTGRAASSSTTSDFFVATRASTAEDFTDVGPVVALNSPVSDSGAAWSADGCALVISSNRAQSATGADLYVASVTPL